MVTRFTSVELSMKCGCHESSVQRKTYLRKLQNRSSQRENLRRLFVECSSQATSRVINSGAMLWLAPAIFDLEFLIMPRIQGVDIPNEKPTYISLTYLYGIGNATAIDLCHILGIDPQMKAKDLSEDEIAGINNHLDNELVLEGQLRRQVQNDIARLRDIKSYRGLRHRRGLPVRGQRTRTNARTRKGAKKTVAGKKGVKDMRH